ncbi:MAG TPA: LysR family transcriptional regulator [Conexibacter sp.]|nr:LysR family transcriptional regulator [Conexibacter sp.]
MVLPAPAPFLNLRLLSYWVAVVEEGSVTAAARRIGVPQPSLSQQMRTLERAVGGELLERQPTGVRLTDAGRAFLPEARAALAAAERATRAAREALGLERGLLQIATYPSLASGALLTSLGTWRQRHPGVQVRLLELAHHELIEGIDRGLADFGVGYAPPSWPGTVTRVGWEEFVLVLPPHDEAAGGKGPIELAELADREWVLYDARLGLARLAADACTDAGFRPRIAIQTSQVEAAARLAVTGLGPTLAPRNNVPPDLLGAVRALARPPVWEIAAFTRRTWSPAAAAYLEILRGEHWPDPPPGALRLAPV